MNEVKQLQPGQHRIRRWVQAGIAAALGLGAYQIYQFTRPASPPIVYDAGRIVAAAELDYVLDDPSQGGGASGITAGEPFAGVSGDKCRRFAQGYLSGTACFKDGVWRLIEIKQANPPASESAGGIRGTNSDR